MNVFRVARYQVWRAWQAVAPRARLDVIEKGKVRTEVVRNEAGLGPSGLQPITQRGR